MQQRFVSITGGDSNEAQKEIPSMIWGGHRRYFNVLF